MNGQIIELYLISVFLSNFIDDNGQKDIHYPDFYSPIESIFSALENPFSSSIFSHSHADSDEFRSQLIPQRPCLTTQIRATELPRPLQTYPKRIQISDEEDEEILYSLINSEL